MMLFRRKREREESLQATDGQPGVADESSREKNAGWVADPELDRSVNAAVQDDDDDG
jgi:hypothetical protein